VSDAEIKVAAHQKHRSCHWCIECRQVWPCLTRRLADDLAAANATIAALQADLAGTAELLLREQALAESQRLALATMREALEHVLTESEWVKKRNEWSSYGQTVGMQPTADRACQEIHFIARQALAQPADDAAALAGAVLEAADDVAHWLHEYLGVIQGNAMRNGNDAELDLVDEALDAYRRARAALRGSQA
jgi:hypothetical protein